MRKLLVAVLTGALVVGAVGVAEAAQRQAIRGVTVPKKMGKFRYSWASLRVLTATWDTTGAQPSPANRAIIDLDNDIWINTFGLPRCALNRIQGQTFQVARNRCRRAIVGYGNATAQLGGATIPVTVTAFNGRPQGRRPTIYLHSDPGFDPQILVGVLLRRAPGFDFGNRVIISIPPLAGGAASLVRFFVRLQKRYRFRGRLFNYISARCRDRNRLLNYRGIFTFDSGQTLVARSASRCFPVRA